MLWLEQYLRCSETTVSTTEARMDLPWNRELTKWHLAAHCGLEEPYSIRIYFDSVMHQIVRHSCNLIRLHSRDTV